MRRPVGLSLLLGGLVLAGGARAETPAPARIELSGMTFVGSRSGEQDMVLLSERVWLVPGSDIAQLEGVHARMQEHETAGLFELRCDRGELDLRSLDFRSRGNVVARTGDGRRLYTSAVRYSSAQGVVASDAPVRIEDEVGTLRGRGFRYHVREGRLVLLGGARVEAAQ